jgi:hypothetical protein
MPFELVISIQQIQFFLEDMLGHETSSIPTSSPMIFVSS